jgi:(p)ppGpp synthase/HD superfamily hydrolase
VRAVAAGLAPFGDELVMAGLLHDIIEDTDWTADRLLEEGIPPRVVSAVEAVTNQRGMPYEEKIRRIVRDSDATLVKIADNAHNSRPDRAAQTP